MATKFLDYTGLSYLWEKIKDWVHSLFVHKVGDDTITGTLTITRTADPIWLGMQHTKYVKGTNPSRAYYHSIVFTDSVGTNMVNRTGFVECYVNPSGVTCTQMAACKYESGSTAFDTIGIFCNPDGTAYTYAPTPANSDSSSKIATTNWVRTATGSTTLNAANVTGTVAIANGGTGATTRLAAVKNLTEENVGTSAEYFLTITRNWGKAGFSTVNDAKTVLGLKSAAYTESSAYVDVTSNQTVAGEKTFTNPVSAKFSVPCIVIANTDYTKGTIPSNTKYSRLFFSDTTGDVASHRIAMVETSVNSSGRTAAALGVYKFSDTDTTAWGGIGVYYDADGTSAYTSAPNPPGDDASTKIATTYFVNQNYVTRATNQTISGQKTFTQELHFKNTGISSSTATLTANKFFNLFFVANNNDSLGRFLYYNNANNGTRGVNFDLVDNTNTNRTVFAYAIQANGTNGTVWVGNCVTKFCASVADCTLGGNNTNQRWGQIYSSITTISTSDERVKTEIANVPDEVLDCWEDVSWVQFKMIDSVKEKGDSARLHNGMIAQNIKSIFESSGLDASKYGLFCYDEWDAEKATYDDEGNIIQQEQEAGNLYSLRYEEALCMEAAYQRRKNKILENRISELEKRLAKLEGVV